MVLFSDMLLLCRPDKDGSLHVLSDPVVLQDICQIETHKKHSEFRPVPFCCDGRQLWPQHN